MRILVTVALIVLGFAGDALAQSCASTQGQLEYCKALTPAVRFGFPRYTTALLPTCNANNKGAVVFDTTDGFFKNCDGSAWAAFASGGSGDVTAVGDCTTGACFNGTQGTTLTFNNAGGDATIDYDGTDFSISKPIVVTGTIGLTSTITFPDNVRQTANPGADAAGLNVGAVAGDPGTPSNGDIWYDSVAETLDARINGATVSLGAGGGAPTDATYLTQVAEAGLSAEQPLAALATGCLSSTTTTGVAATRTLTGTANEIAVANGDCSGTPTFSLPATIDLGGKTSLEIPNGAAPTVDAFGEIAGDNDLWAASRGAPVFFDGTASTALVNVLVSDAPSNGQVPTWNTGGTITWESVGVTYPLTATAADNCASVPYSFTGDSNTGICSSAADTVGFHAGANVPFSCTASDCTVYSTNPLQFASSGESFRSVGTNRIMVKAGGFDRAIFDGNGGGLGLASGGYFSWSSDQFDPTSRETYFERVAAGVVKGATSSGIFSLIGGGAAVASATALPVPTGRVFHVTGTTTVTSMTSTGFAHGTCVTLIFDGILTFTDGNNLKLAGDFTTSADDTISLCYDGTNWFETGRSVN